LAYNSADELLLEFLETQDLVNKSILICNDAFGALSSHLHDFDITVVSDSYLSKMSIDLNTEGRIISQTSVPDRDTKYDIVVFKIPKNLAYFEDLLCQLRKFSHKETSFIFGSMVKHLSNGAFSIIEKKIGKTTTSLAKKKARLIFANFEAPDCIKFKNKTIKVEGLDKELENFSNVFSRDKLDIGAAFFRQYIPKSSYKEILDLGCGNGVLGIWAKKNNPLARITFTDDSHMAVENAKFNYHKLYTDKPVGVWTNCGESLPDNYFDLVLCNPPFHQDHTIGDFIAVQMFIEAKRVLASGGVLRVIGNSHLKYNFKLKELFGSYKLIATNSKFNIYECILS